MRAGATITRTGLHSFSREELAGVNGLPDADRVLVEFTPESVFHNDTLSSIRGAVVTLGHPKDQRLVTPETWRHHSRGSVAGEPVALKNEGLISGEVILGDVDAINSLDSGIEELSIGYTMNLERVESGNAHFRTNGPILVNHIAMVDEGRSGDVVRVQNQEGLNMDDAQIAKLAAGIGESLKTQLQPLLGVNAAAPGNSPDIGKIVSDALTAGLKPVVEQIQSVVTSNAEVEAANKKEEAERKAKESADQFKAKVLSDERNRVAVLNQASALIPQEQLIPLQNSSVKEILVVACQNIVPDAANQTEDYLRGVLAMQAQNRQAPGFAAGMTMVPGAPAGAPAPGSPMYPATGVVPPAPVTAVNETDQAYSEYVQHLQNAHLGGNEKVN